MAHHRHLSQDSAAIFSPSVARIAASDARDWSYVDSWLESKFPGRQPPTFERNPDTLKALLALVSVNELADEERQLVSRAESDALKRINSSQGEGGEGAGLREGLLGAVEDELSPEGQIALDSIASMAVRAGIAFPDTEDLGRTMVDMHKSVYEADRMKQRVEILQESINHEQKHMRDLLRSLKSDDYKPPPELAKQNLDVQRKLKTMSVQLPELEGRVADIASQMGSTNITIDEIAHEEKKYLAILSQKKHLDQQLAAFEGLPSDPSAAREELDTLRDQLQGARMRRDAVFEGLVELESPDKRRR